MNYMVKDFISQFESETDERTKCTKAIQAAIDSCEKTGGVVWTEKDCVYPVGGIELKSGVYLYLAQGCVLQAGPDVKAYKMPVDENGEKVHPDRYCGRPPYALIYAKDAKNLGIIGSGSIDGVSQKFITQKGTYHNSGVYPRPEIIYMEGCSGVEFKHFEIKQAPFWTLHIAGCEDVIIEDVKIHNDLSMANSDGIDPDHCKNVVIRNCEVQSADDAICLKNTAANSRYGKCENIRIENCRLISTSAGIKIGTEGIDDFSNIQVKNCSIEKSNRGVSIQIRDNGNVENVRFENIKIETRRFHDAWWGKGECIYISSIKRSPERCVGKISNVKFKNVSCDSENGVYIYAEQEGAVTDIGFDALHIEMKKKTKWSAGTYDLRPCWKGGVETRENVLFYSENATDVHVSNATFEMPVEKVDGFGDFLYDNTHRVVFEKVEKNRV